MDKIKKLLTLNLEIEGMLQILRVRNSVEALELLKEKCDKFNATFQQLYPEMLQTIEYNHNRINSDPAPSEKKTAVVTPMPKVVEETVLVEGSTDKDPIKMDGTTETEVETDENSVEEEAENKVTEEFTEEETVEQESEDEAADDGNEEETAEEESADEAPANEEPSEEVRVEDEEPTDVIAEDEVADEVEDDVIIPDPNEMPLRVMETTFHIPEEEEDITEPNEIADEFIPVASTHQEEVEYHPEAPVFNMPEVKTVTEEKKNETTSVSQNSPANPVDISNLNINTSAPGSLNDKIARKGAADLSKAFTLNDKFRFIRELFHGDAKKYNNAIAELSKKDSFYDAAMYVVSELKLDPDNETVGTFLTIISNHFSE